SRRDGRAISDQRDVDLADPGPTATTEELPRLVRRDLREPGPEMLGLTQARQLPPRDRPRGLRRVMGEVGIAADEKGDPDQVVVVLRDDPAERDAITGRRRRDQRRRETQIRRDVHALEMLRDGQLMHPFVRRGGPPPPPPPPPPAR